LLPVAGSQAAIQTLPFLFSAPLRVGSFTNHLQRTRARVAARGSHTCSRWMNLPSMQISIRSTSCYWLIPTTPPARFFHAHSYCNGMHNSSQKMALSLSMKRLSTATRNTVWLQDAQQTGLIVLRSLGKFFGLAGARVGFVFAETKILAALRETLGPWPISHPSRIAAQRALSDSTWQQQQREMLPQQSARLAQLLTENGLAPTGGCALFQWIQTPTAAAIHHHLAAQGILTRLYTTPASLRLGLPAEEAEWERLASALKCALPNHHI
jgi:hypothetical protein